MLEQSSLIAIGSALATIGTIVGVTKSNQANMKENQDRSNTEFKKNLSEFKKSLSELKDEFKTSLSDFKCDIKDEIIREKSHAVQLVNQRMGNIEKDVDEIFPRLRKVEDDSQKNCYALTTMQKNCVKHKKEVEDDK